MKEKESEEEEEERALPARTHTADTQVNNPDPTAPPKGDKPPSAGKNSGEKNRSGKVPWPDDFTLTEARRQVAIKHDRDPDREWECFHAHALMNRATRVDWPQAWVYWCTNGIGRDIRGRVANHGPPSKIEQFKDPLADIRISDEERERNAGKFREMLARGTTKHL